MCILPLGSKPSYKLKPWFAEPRPLAKSNDRNSCSDIHSSPTERMRSRSCSSSGVHSRSGSCSFGGFFDLLSSFFGAHFGCFSSFDFSSAFGALLRVLSVQFNERGTCKYRGYGEWMHVSFFRST
jgi:hypothetical protein